MSKILLVEDEVKVVQALKKGLEEQGYEVDFAYNGHEGLKLAERKSYDVVVSDVIMPQMTGTQMVQELRGKGIDTPVLMLTALDAVEERVGGLEAGADDYMSKPFAFSEFLARIKALIRRGGNPYQPKQILSFSTIEMNLDSKEIQREGKKIDLTPKEFALMEYFIRNKERVISKTEIAEKVWDIDFEINTNVIEVYINYLRNKIDKPFEKKLIHTQFGMGYILKEG